MAKSKLIKANKKIAEGVTTGFQKMSDGVVGGYKKIEDAFVDRYLTHDGETVEEAKARLKAEEDARRETANAELGIHHQSTNEIVQESLKRAHERSHK